MSKEQAENPFPSILEQTSTRREFGAGLIRLAKAAFVASLVPTVLLDAGCAKKDPEPQTDMENKVAGMIDKYRNVLKHPGVNESIALSLINSASSNEMGINGVLAQYDEAKSINGIDADTATAFVTISNLDSSSLTKVADSYKKMILYPGVKDKATALQIVTASALGSNSLDSAAATFDAVSKKEDIDHEDAGFVTLLTAITGDVDKSIELINQSEENADQSTKNALRLALGGAMKDEALDNLTALWQQFKKKGYSETTATTLALSANMNGYDETLAMVDFAKKYNGIDSAKAASLVLTLVSDDNNKDFSFSNVDKKVVAATRASSDNTFIYYMLYYHLFFADTSPNYIGRYSSSYKNYTSPTFRVGLKTSGMQIGSKPSGTSAFKSGGAATTIGKGAGAAKISGGAAPSIKGGGIRGGGRCLPGKTLISTSNGQKAVKNLKKGDLVWTVDSKGHKKSVPILAVSRVEAPKTHKVREICLSDGRKLTASPKHPTADGRTLAQLKMNDKLDGAIVVKAENVRYTQKYTYDLLPEGESGSYFAENVLIGSTLFVKKIDFTVFEIIRHSFTLSSWLNH